MMPTLRWDRLEWDAFLRELESYRRRIEAGSSEDRTYGICLDALSGPDALADLRKRPRQESSLEIDRVPVSIQWNSHLGEPLA